MPDFDLQRDHDAAMKHVEELLINLTQRLRDPFAQPGWIAVPRKEAYEMSASLTLLKALLGEITATLQRLVDQDRGLLDNTSRP